MIANTPAPVPTARLIFIARTAVLTLARLLPLDSFRAVLLALCRGCLEGPAQEGGAAVSFIRAALALLMAGCATASTSTVAAENVDRSTVAGCTTVERTTGVSVSLTVGPVTQPQTLRVTGAVEQTVRLEVGTSVRLASSNSIELTDPEGGARATIRWIELPFRDSPFIYEGFVFTKVEQTGPSRRVRIGTLNAHVPVPVRVDEEWSVAVSECHGLSR